MRTDLTALQVNRSIGQRSGKTWAGQLLLQPICFKSGRLDDSACGLICVPE
jgi:hypothetical protein